MKKTVKWFKAPNTAGLWWYWLLGSGIVRTQRTWKGHGYGIVEKKEYKGKILIDNGDGPMLASKCARLWCRSTRTPRLPSKKLQNELAKRRGV